MISIVVSIYNGEKYLKRCLDSILEQEKKDFELILVNDGSTDSSLDICKNYKSKFSNCILIDKKNGGLSSAREAGYKVSKGEYIIFIDCDDYVDCNWIKELNNVIIHHQPDLIIYNYNFIIDENNIEKKKINLRKGLNSQNITENFNIPTIGKKFNDSYFIPAFLWLRCIKRNLIEDSFFISERICYTEDILFDLLINKKIENYFYLDKTLYNYCLNKESLTNRYRENMWSMFEFRYKWIHEYCEKNRIMSLASERLDTLIWNSCIEAINNLCKNNDYSLAKKGFKEIRNNKIVYYILKKIRNKMNLSTHDKLQYIIIKYRLFFLYYQYKNIIKK